MKPKTPSKAVELLLAALADRRWEDVIPLIRPEAAHRIIAEAKDDLRYRLGAESDNEAAASIGALLDEDAEQAQEASRERQARTRAAWGINDPGELEELPAREFFIRYLAAQELLEEADPFTQRDWRVLGAVRQNAYAAHVVYERRAFASVWRWPENCPMGTHLVRVQRVNGDWRVDVNREFFDVFRGYRYHRDGGDPIGTAMTYVIAEVWREVARDAGDHPLIERGKLFYDSQTRRLKAAALHLENLLEWVFIDPGAAKAELQCRLDEADDAVWLLLEDPGAFSPIFRDVGSEVLVAGIFSYAARVSAFHLLGLSVPASEGTPMLADLVARRLSGVMDEFAAELGPPGLERLESALLQVVGTSPMERAALGMLVPEIYELLSKVRESRLSGSSAG